MAVPRRRKRRYYKDLFSEDPGDGLEVNNINPARMISKKGHFVSMFDADNIAVELTKPGGKRSFKRVSVMGDVRKANISKTRKMNRYKERIKGR